MAFTTLLVGILLFAFVFWFNSSKGKIGEEKMAVLLKLLPKEYVVLNNVIISNGESMAQIDHVVVSPYGIFVIETKNYKGWIFGKDYYKQWTQNIYGKKYKFYNPVKQNETHVRALRKLLYQFGGISYISIIAFSSKTSLFVESEEAYVTHILKVNSIIKDYIIKQVSTEHVEQIVQLINERRYIGDIAEDLHLDYVYSGKHHYEIAMEQGKCPWCGGTLMVRNGRHGRFYGCSNYPRCKFTHNV
ncbi:NERD domain-containing protein [Prevotella cerevisiae]|uniref:NERD domain-containing protein n=1 Tax=Segatella cerevisiae TaxID=2053716 RepID=A0ABT1BYU3_9BACT|nr:NERD domain-containing protein [Segatella cerevisiae]MCO6026149.1 NERD domain-containing protein [Segatella cerevisiae]